MDWDAVVDELYGLPPGEFTAARDERARAALAAGDRESAERIRRLRRPTLAAWAGNLLVRERPDEVERLLELGAALRRAHQDLDGGQLRELSARQHQLTSVLARQAGRLAAQAGRRLGDDTRQEVQDTLHAVLADPEAAENWAKGHLAKPLSAPVGFPAFLREAGATPATRRARPVDEVADLDSARVRRREQQERLEQARQRAADAERELHDREDGLTAAKEEQSRAEEEQQRAEQRVDELSRQLEHAEREQRAAMEAAHRARDHTRDVDRTVREARRRARDAAARARRLAEQTRQHKV
ncbi:hypothetical protein ACWCRF_13430 [Streptomyces sp. NPDC002405]|uniref:hypothetical protein n=1 Tax=Streptomyces sp. NPDC057596 TaxID=3346178 RepID=UPI0036C4060D